MYVCTPIPRPIPQAPSQPPTHPTPPQNQTGETTEQAVIREVREETGAEPYDLRLLGVYSHPDRDDRRHTVSATYVASISGRLKAGDDAKEVALVKPELAMANIEGLRLAFDHADFLRDYFRVGGFVPGPRAGTSLCPVADRRGVVVGGSGGGGM